MQNEQKITKEEINKNIDYHISEIGREFRKGFEFLEKYQFSSYSDFLGRNRNESAIIDFSLIPDYIKDMKMHLSWDEYLNSKPRT